MAVLRLALIVATIASALGIALGLILAIWAFFISGDCSLWLQSKVPFSGPIQVLGAPYTPVCEGVAVWSYHLSRLCIVFGVPIALILIYAIPRLARTPGLAAQDDA